MPETPPFIVCFGPLQLDLKAGELLKDGSKVRLHEQPFQILQMLLEHPGEVVTRAEIRKKLWPNDTVVEFDHSINAAIQKLRQALGDSAENPKYVETVARRGYRLLVPVGRMEPQSADPRGAPPHTGVQPQPPARESLIGKKVSHYRVLEVLGAGGMGVVYKGEDLKLGRRVALKFLPEELSGNAAAMERFKREARAAATLNHPNICTIYEVEELARQPFIVMELLEGQTLRELVSASGQANPPLELRSLLDLAIQITEGLEAAHRQGIIHRDIKPANIFVTSHGQAKIFDFGLAKFAPVTTVVSDVSEPERHAASPQAGLRETPRQTTPRSFLSRTGVAMGTAGYMSPEQVRGEKLDARTDLFSFGLVLYEMTTGQRAFTGETEPLLRAAILHHDPSPVLELNPEVPARLQAIINRALQKDRELRYQSASELGADLETLKQSVEPKPRARWLEFAAVGIVILLTAGTIFWFANRQRPSFAVAPEIKLRQLTANSSENRVTGGAISPDGKYLAYVALKGMHIKLINTGEIQTVPLPELDQIRNLEWDISPSGWFPDSTRFLATAHEAANLNTGDWTSEGSSIWMVSVLGGAPHKLRDNAVAFSVSPDGSLVSFGTNKGRLGDREIWLMGTNGERAQKSIETDENSWIVGTNWSADGRRVIYARIDDSGVGLFSRDLKGGLLTTVIPPSEGINVTHAVWSPDGRLIYSVREPGSIRDTCNYWAMRLDARTGEPLEKPRRLTTVARPCMWTESVTADGRRLAFLEMLNHATVYVADLQAGGTRILNSRHFTLDESFAFQEDWTIDGKAILFISNRAGQYGIYKQSLDQETPDLIAAGAGDFGNVRASPDGKWIIAFLYPKRGGPSGSEQLMRIPISGGGPELMFSARLRSQMSCAKPPSTLCVVAEPAEDRKQLIVTSFDAIKGRGLKLTRFDLDPKEDRWSCEISADGTRIAATRSPAGPIYILSLEEQTERAIPAKELKNIQVFRWAADGKGLFVGEEASGGSLLLYVDMNGNSHVLSENHAGNRAIGVPSPDGRQLATLGWSMDGNMWLMENF